MTIIAVPTFENGGLNSQLNARFGRCQSFTFVTVKNGEIEAVKTVPNSAANAMGGAGIQAAQIIGNNGAEAVIVGNLGPNAAQSLNSLNLKIYQAPGQVTVKQAVQSYINGELNEISGANVGAHFGMGGGGGRGMGGGGGRGMGGGGGRRNF
ncbi:MAG: NifB/NifX family molybdenum-iron cluster-binding protein [Promethearchaeia archaeon]